MVMPFAENAIAPLDCSVTLPLTPRLPAGTLTVSDPALSDCVRDRFPVAWVIDTAPVVLNAPARWLNALATARLPLPLYAPPFSVKLSVVRGPLFVSVPPPMVSPPLTDDAPPASVRVPPLWIVRPCWLVTL